MRNGSGSFWLDSIRHEDPHASRQRPRLDGDIDADVIIIGAGYTGLWTAYWLTRLDPGLDVVVLEAEHIGYGASGRNGGWITGKTVGLRDVLAGSTDPAARAAVLDIERACHRAVTEIPAIMDAAGIDIGARHGGWMQIARTPAELARLHAHLAADCAWGLGPEDVGILSAAEAYERLHVRDLTGALHSPHAVRCQPARLVYGLAELCERAGVRIFEATRVEDVEAPRPSRRPAPTSHRPAPAGRGPSSTGTRVRTARGSARAERIVLAVEGYTAGLPGRRRDILPMVSSMIVTAPLPAQVWEAIGWAGAECVSGAQHTYFYSQRTDDDRIAIGGRGVPYLFGSADTGSGALDEGTIGLLTGILTDLFPGLDLPIEHAWRGVLGVSRDWSPFIDASDPGGLIRLGGYAGQGVAAAHVAGRTAAELITGRTSELTRSPWVRPAPRRWEPEPMRWLGSRAVQRLYGLADRAEARRSGTHTSGLARLADWASGRG